MAVRVKISPINLDYKLVLDQTLSEQAQSQVLASYADQAIEDAKAKNARVLGKVPPYTVAVDGRILSGQKRHIPGLSCADRRRDCCR
jgi:hypothetical protein